MKRIRYTAEDVFEMSRRLTGTENCTVNLAIGLGNGNSPSELMALRRATKYEFGNRGNDYLLATSTQRETALARNLRRAGFKKLATIKNSNTKNTVTLWGAKSLKNGGARVEEGISSRW